MIDFIAEIGPQAGAGSLENLFIKKPANWIYSRNQVYELVLWGDPIGGEALIENHPSGADHRQLLAEVYGHYYFLLLDRRERRIVAGNSLFSILPLYYAEKNGSVYLSNNAIDLGSHLGLSTVSKRFVLETMLFNYPLFNHSIISSVMLLPSNSSMVITDGRKSIPRHTDIAEHFTGSPLPWRKSSGHLTEMFLSSVRKYLPPEKYVNSLTGGFDSRTLAAAGMYHKRNFTCSGFGAAGSKDIVIAANVAKLTGLPWKEIVLDDAYARDESLRNGFDFIRNSSGTATFVRAHYLHAAAVVAEESPVLVTGNFGSELFRAAHVRGVVFSPNLADLFSSSSPDDALKRIGASREFLALGITGYRDAWNELRQDITGLPCFSRGYRHLTLNQQFYVFVFEEVFRKYFGAEMVSQFTLLKNRTPYLDFDFVRGLLNTGLAGIHSDFFEHNPFRRYKGQVLYAHIIRKAYPELGRIATDKGYRPEDLLTAAGQLKVLRGYLQKKQKSQPAVNDPYSVNRAFRVNLDFLRQFAPDPELFGGGVFTDGSWSQPDSLLFKAVSLTWLSRSLGGGPEFSFSGRDKG